MAIQGTSITGSQTSLRRMNHGVTGVSYREYTASLVLAKNVARFTGRTGRYNLGDQIGGVFAYVDVIFERTDDIEVRLMRVEALHGGGEHCEAEQDS